jgi:hypothetical protein
VVENNNGGPVIEFTSQVRLMRLLVLPDYQAEFAQNQ